MDDVAIDNVSKDYFLGRVRVAALQNVTVSVRAGEFLAIAGPSGSGKTTLLNLIGCMDTPTSGVLRVAGRDIAQLSEGGLTALRRETLGFIFQTFNLVAALSLFHNVELPLLLQGRLGNRDRRRRVEDLLDRVGLRDHVRHRPGELSGGQRQRAAIARALVTRPRIVLADEPTANLDSATGEQVIGLMRELNRSEATTFIFSTHDSRVMAQATQLFRLADGRLVADSGAPEPVRPPAPPDPREGAARAP